MYVNEEAREQLNLFEEKLDNIIGEDNAVRFIDAYIDRLDLKKSVSSGKAGGLISPIRALILASP